MRMVKIWIETKEYGGLGLGLGLGLEEMDEDMREIEKREWHWS